jgi:transcriptional regulator with XRE-family HTH domain
MQINPDALVWLRKRSGFSQLELAEKADVRADALNHIEKGRRDPTDEQAARIARALSIPITALESKAAAS